MKIINLLTILFLICLIFSLQAQNTENNLPTILETDRPEYTAEEVLKMSDDKLLDELEFRLFKYFWQEVFDTTGIAYDHTENAIGKVAATGFELAAVCIGIQRKWISYELGYQRVHRILDSFWDDPEDPDDIYAEGHFGLFWHFVNGDTGKMMPMDCVAMCDSADFIAGVVIAEEFFKGTEIEILARKIMDNIQWDQFVHPDNGTPGLLSWGWVPKNTIENRMDIDGLLPGGMTFLSDNSLLIYCLALGSETHPIPQQTWEKYLDTMETGEYAGYECAKTGALFCRQVPHCFINFSRKRDRKIEYYLDTVNAILADQAFNIKENGYPPQLWGLTDCFGKNSYGHSAPPGYISNDGTAGTTAMVSALPMLPKLSLDSIRYLLKTFDDRIWQEYGLTSTANAKNNFVSPLFVGIETGPMINMIENYRSGLIWELFMRSRYMQNFIKRAKLSGVIDDFELPPQTPAYAVWKISKGKLQLSTDLPQHGRKCLVIEKAKGSITLEGTLPENDLLDFQFANYLSLYTRDLDRLSCALIINKKKYDLARQQEVSVGSWQQIFFKIPEYTQGAGLRNIIIKAKISGQEPAIDNISCDPEVKIFLPGAITDLKASRGKVSQTVRLTWTAPDNGEGRKVDQYLLAWSKEPIRNYRDLFKAQTRRIMLNIRQPGEQQQQLLYIPGGGKYFFNIISYNEIYHVSPLAAPAELDIDSSAIEADTLAYDFEHTDLKDWFAVEPAIKLSIVNDPSSTDTENRVLRIDYSKSNDWDYIIFPISGDLTEVFRYITMKVRGNTTILGKLWCNDELSQDMNRESFAGDTWTLIKFDTQVPEQLRNHLAEVKKMLLFVEPGRKNVQGTVYIDDIKFSHE